MDPLPRLIGVFTWKSFAKRAADLRSVRGSFKPVDMPVREALEPAKFIDPEVYIDTETDRRRSGLGGDVFGTRGRRRILALRSGSSVTVGRGTASRAGVE